jgi:hypothetical protein
MKSIFFIIFVLVGFSLNAQVASNTESKDSTNIYFQSIEILCKKLHNKFETLFVEQNNLTTNSLPLKIGEHEIKIIDITELKKLVKKNKDIEIVSIIPLRVKTGEFFVNIIYFSVKIERKQIIFINKGGYSVVFEYDTNTNSFISEEIR